MYKKIINYILQKKHLFLTKWLQVIFNVQKKCNLFKYRVHTVETKIFIKIQF